MSIIPRPLKQVLGKIIPFSQADKIPTFNLGSGTADSTTYLRGDGTWSSVTGSASNKMYTVGRNSTGSTLYKGTIVYISGSTGNIPNFVKAQANSEVTSAGTFGVIEVDIPNNSDGNCVTIGTIDNLDTRTIATHPFTDVTLADGDTIYLHPTIAGYITNVKPSAPNHLVYVGKVVRTHPTLGTIVYRIQNGYEIDELHDVAISSPTNGQILQYESATSLWKNVTPSSGGLTVGTTAITSGTAGRVLFEGATNKLNESANFYWDNTNSRLSVGMGSSPTAIVDIKAGGATSTDYAVRARNSVNTKDLLLIRGNGDHELGATGSPSLSLIASSGFSYPGLTFVGQGGTEKSQIYMTSNRMTFLHTTSNTATTTMNTTGIAVGFGDTGASARIDIKAQGSLSTDLALRVRNSANTANLFSVQGDGYQNFLFGKGNVMNLGAAPETSNTHPYLKIYNAGSTSHSFASFYNDAGIALSIGAPRNIVNGFNDTTSYTNAVGSFMGLASASTYPTSRQYQAGVCGLTPFSQGTNDSGWAQTGADTAGNNSMYVNYIGRSIILGGTTQGTGTRKIVLNNGTAPSTNLTDAFQQYSADIVAGNAAPHFRTEAGDIIKLYKETTAVTASTFVTNTSLIANDTATFDGYTIGQVVKALRNIGILA